MISYIRLEGKGGECVQLIVLRKIVERVLVWRSHFEASFFVYLVALSSCLGGIRFSMTASDPLPPPPPLYVRDPDPRDTIKHRGTARRCGVPEAASPRTRGGDDTAASTNVAYFALLDNLLSTLCVA